MTWPDARKSLREPFPDSLIGHIPASRGRPELDYVGHAAVTDRLNTHVPEATWTVDREFVHNGQYWILGTMTIGEVSRPEYGDGKDPKEAIGNFIRRAAMRFGVAIDLWSREELEDGSESGEPSSPAGEGEPSPAGPSPANVTAAAGEGTASSEARSPDASTEPAESPPSPPAGEAAGGGVSPPGPSIPSDATKADLLQRLREDAPLQGFHPAQAIARATGRVCKEGDEDKATKNVLQVTLGWLDREREKAGVLTQRDSGVLSQEDIEEVAPNLAQYAKEQAQT
jgi:hypothetical protein